MPNHAMDTYLNDHLAGATTSVELVENLQDEHKGTPFADFLVTLHREIEQDRQTLMDLMERMGIVESPVKKAGAWVMEKASQLMTAGLSSGDAELGTFMALESLSLGIEGKRTLWRSLGEVTDQYSALEPLNLEELVARAEEQRAGVEREHVALARRALQRQLEDA